jgi:hypothetical protein
MVEVARKSFADGRWQMADGKIFCDLPFADLSFSSMASPFAFRPSP